MDNLVSVIVLTWNRAALLKETVDSILSQTYSHFELLIVDNESTDGTAKYVSGLGDKRIKYFRNPNNGILSVARNYGIERAGGSFIAFCDDDDLWLPDRLEKQMAFIRQHPEYKVVCANGVYFDDQGDIDRLIKRKTGDLALDDFLKGDNNVVLASVLISKDVFSAIGLYNEDPRIVNTEDYEFMVRAAARRYPMRFIGENLVRYRMHAVMASHANTLVTIGKVKLFFKMLYDSEVLSRSEYKTVRRNLTKKHIAAFIKELFKKSKSIKRSVYFFRRVRLSRPGG